MTAREHAPSIYKFGGAALADAAALRHAVSIVARRRHEPTVVVVSAIAGTTDALLAMAERAAAGDASAAGAAVEQLAARHTTVAESLLAGGARDAMLAAITESFTELERIAVGLSALRELTPRTRDHIVSRGERLAARLVAAALCAAEIPAELVDATEIIQTDGRFERAFPDLERTARTARRRLGPLLRRGSVPVVPGFIGAGPDGQVVTLGRGGSDLTATTLGRVLAAREVVLWKDVGGLLTADPRAVPDARVIPQLHAREAAELAYHGARVLHPRCLIPLRGGMRLFIRPFADESAPGTEISRRRTLARYPVKALSVLGGQALVTVSGNGMLGVPGIAARTFGALHQAGISVSLISQASSEHSICLGVPAGAADEARARLLDAFAGELERGEIDGVDVRADVATIAIVGLGMAGTPGIAAQLFSTVARAGINVIAIAQGSSELNVSFVVDARDAAVAQRRIHDAFQLSKINGGAADRTERSDVILLGFGQVGRELAQQLAAPTPRARRVRVVAVVDRSGFVFDPRGLSRRVLGELATAKARGESLARLPTGQAASAPEAVAWIAGHALSRPVLVDVTASETGAILESALGQGMHVVLANKRPLTASRSTAARLLRAARTTGARLLHEATVGAGLPIIDTYHKLAESGDRVLCIEGCPSGTMGYLFGELARGRPFSEALRSAMALGYTEPDPRDDLSGMDVARKALILGRLLGYRGELADVAVESLVPVALRGIPREEFLARLEELDGAWAHRVGEARARGVVLRYRARATRQEVSVGLVAVDASSSLAALDGTDNQFAFTTERYRTNPLVITGPGAGPAVTAAGVLNDVLKAAGS